MPSSRHTSAHAALTHSSETEEAQKEGLPTEVYTIENRGFELPLKPVQSIMGSNIIADVDDYSDSFKVRISLIFST